MISAALIGLTYGLYPALRLLRLRKSTRGCQDMEFQPEVSIIFAAYNEKEVIEEKIHSIYATRYDTTKVTVYIGSDQSNDGTDEIIKSMQSQYPNLNLYRTKERIGKSSIMNILAEKANGNILIATDANIIFKEDTIVQLVASFHSHRVAAVAGALTYSGKVSNNTAKTEGAYLNLENAIRQSESQCFGFCLGMEGGLYAIRKELWRPIPKATFMEDFFQTMQLLVDDYQIAFNSKAIGYEEVSTSFEEEFKRKIRISLGNFQNLKRFRSVLIKKVWPLGYAFLLHKVLRWFTPHIIIILILALMLNPTTQVYGLVLLAFLPFQFLLVKFKIHGPITYFCAMNAAMLIGHFLYLKGVSSSVWEPTKRIQE